MNKKKTWAAALSVAVSLSVLSGCGGEDTSALESQVAALKAQNTQLQQQVADGTITEQSNDTSLRVIDGTSRALFGTIDGEIKFPNELKIPNTQVDSNESRIQVGSLYTFASSGAWQFKLDGTQLNMQHPQKIWGQIKTVRYDTIESVEGVKAILQNFYKGFPTTTISYRNVFIGSSMSGVLSQAKINVDKKDYQVMAGIIESNDVGMLVLFVFKDDGTGVQQELISSFLSTGMARGNLFALD